MKKSFSKTTILLGIALLFTVVAGGAYAFLFVAMKNKTQATAELSAKIGEISGKESRVASAMLTLKDEAPNIEKLSAYFIKGSEIVAFMKKIEELGPQSGTELSIVSLDPGLTEKTVPFLSLRIKATGEFVDVARLLALLENFPGKFEWKTVRLVRDDSVTPQTTEGTPKSKGANSPQWMVEVFLTALNFTKE